MRRVHITIICSLASILLIGCGPAEFGSSNAQGKANGAAETNGADGALNQADGNGADGMLGSDDDNDAAGMLPPMTADEAAGLIRGIAGANPSAGALEQIVENQLESLRCYISGGGGHGIDMCMADTTPVRFLSPRAERGTFIEIKGSQLCVPPAVLLANLDKFKTAVTGTCGTTAP